MNFQNAIFAAQLTILVGEVITHVGTAISAVGIATSVISVAAGTVSYAVGGVVYAGSAVKEIVTNTNTDRIQEMREIQKREEVMEKYIPCKLHEEGDFMMLEHL